MSGPRDEPVSVDDEEAALLARQRERQAAVLRARFGNAPAPASSHERAPAGREAPAAPSPAQHDPLHGVVAVAARPPVVVAPHGPQAVRGVILNPRRAAEANSNTIGGLSAADRALRRRAEREVIRERRSHERPARLRYDGKTLHRLGRLRGKDEATPWEGREFNVVMARILAAADPITYSARLTNGREPGDVIAAISSCGVKGDVHGHLPGTGKKVSYKGESVGCPASEDHYGRHAAGLWTPWYCGERRFCDVESEKYARERQDEIIRLLLDIAQQAATVRHDWTPSLGDFEFTIPQEHREYFAVLGRPMTERHGKYLKVCRASLLRLYREHFDLGGKSDTSRVNTRPKLLDLAFIDNVHPVSSSRPWVAKMHAHVLVPTIGFFRAGRRRAPKGTPRAPPKTYFGRLPHWLTSAQLDRLRAIYREEYEAAFPLKVPEDKDLNVHYSYAPLVAGFSNKRLSREAEHKVRYTFRSFLKDVREGVRTVFEDKRTVYWEFYDKEKRRVLTEFVPIDTFVRGLMTGLATPHRYRRIRYAGWLADRRKRTMLRTLHGCGKCEKTARDPDVCARCAMADSAIAGPPKRKVHECPLCGGEICRFHSGFPSEHDPARLYRVGYDGSRDFIATFCARTLDGFPDETQMARSPDPQ